MGRPQLSRSGGHLRIAISCDSAEIGGAEHSTGNLLATLSPEIRVTVVSVDAQVGRWLAEHRAGTQVVLVPPIRSKRDLPAMRARQRAIAGLRPHVYQASVTTVFSGEYALLSAMRVPGVSTIAVEHTLQFGDVTWLRRKLKRYVAHRVSAHVAVSDAAARAIEDELDLARGSVRTIHNGVPDVELPPAPRRSTGPVLGTFARLVSGKGIDVLCRALTEVPHAHAVVAGAGPGEAELRALALDLGVADRFDLLGFRARPRDLLPGFDVFVLPSRQEALPLSIVEAMLAALPVVATRVGGVHEVVEDRETGLLVPPDDPTALASALNELLGDRDRRDRMGAAGRERALRDFSVDKMTRAYETLYEEIGSAR
jgi:glycosyltransferase involved in cell wall biosynthesis